MGTGPESERQARAGIPHELVDGFPHVLSRFLSLGVVAVVSTQVQNPPGRFQGALSSVPHFGVALQFQDRASGLCPHPSIEVVLADLLRVSIEALLIERDQRVVPA